MCVWCSFFLACEDSRGKFDAKSVRGRLFFFLMEVSSRTTIPLFGPGLVHSGSVSLENSGRTFPDELHACSFHCYIIIIIFYPLTARVVGAPQMISQPVSSIFPCSPLPSVTWRTQACPFPDVVFPPLPLSALSSSPFHCASQYGFGQM